MKRFYLYLLLLSILFSGCVVYVVNDNPDQSLYEDPIEPTFPIDPPAPPPQPPTGPIYLPPVTTLPTAGKIESVVAPAKPVPQPVRPGSDLHETTTRGGASGTTITSTPPARPTNEPVNTNNTEQNTQSSQPSRTGSGRR